MKTRTWKWKENTETRKGKLEAAAKKISLLIRVRWCCAVAALVLCDLQAPLLVVDDNQKVVGALSVVGEVPENFTRLVLLCIEANDCNQIFVGNISRRDLHDTRLCTALKSQFFAKKKLLEFCQKLLFFPKFYKILPNFAEF